MPPITTVEASAFIPEIWLSIALGRLTKYLLLANTCTKDYELGGGTFNVGSKLHIPVRGTVVANDKAEGANFLAQNPQSTTVDVTLNRHKEVTIVGTDVSLALANQNYMMGYIEDGVKAIAEAIEMDLMGLYAGIAPANVITEAANITEADVLAARRILVKNSVNPLDNMYAIVSTAQANALRTSANTVRYDATGEADLLANARIGDGSKPFPGSMGRIFQFNVVESQITDALATSGTTHNLFYSKDAVVLATRALHEPSPGTGAVGTTMTDPQTGITMRMFKAFNAQNGNEQMTIDVLYGFSLLRANHMVVVNAAGG